jgi:hypothetical protein
MVCTATRREMQYVGDAEAKRSGRVTLWASELEQEYCMRSYMASPIVYRERFDGRLETDVKSMGYPR